MEKTIEKEFNLKESFVLWKQTSEKGQAYFSGVTNDGNKVVGFYVTNKKNPKQPDLQIKKDSEEFASLWCNLSKEEKKYLTGSLKTGEKIVGFFAKEEVEKRPFIRVYFKETETEEPKKKISKREKSEVKLDNNDLPF